MKNRTAITPAAEPAPAEGRAAVSARVGMFAPSGLLERAPETARAFLARVEQEGIDHVCCGDHVSFAGLGFDGLVQATALTWMQVWCGLAESKQAARACLAPAMEAFYQLPLERFERYCPYGTAEDVAEFLAPYATAGCTEFNLIPQAPDHDQAIVGTAAVKRLLGSA